MHRVIHSFSAFLRESRRAAASAAGRAEAGRRRPEGRGFATAERTYPLFHTVIHIPFFIMRLCGLCASFCGKSGAEDVYKTQENYKKG